MNSDFEKVKECFFYFINRKRYTKKELIDRVIKREYPEETVKDAADYLEEAGYIDDRDYAVRYIKDAYNIKNYGEIRIKTDLIARGINNNIIEDAFLELDLDFYNLLQRIAVKKSQGIDFSDEKQKNKIAGFLIRRGFRTNDVFEIIRKIEKGDI